MIFTDAVLFTNAVPNILQWHESILDLMLLLVCPAVSSRLPLRHMYQRGRRGTSAYHGNVRHNAERESERRLQQYDEDEACEHRLRG